MWTTSTLHDIIFIPISYIRCRVALSEVEVDFGQFIGKEKVFIVSPLSDS